MFTDTFLLVYLLRIGCAVEIARDLANEWEVRQVPPPFLAGLMLANGRPYCRFHEEYAALGGRVVTAFEERQGPATRPSPALVPEGK